jgi:GH15 family glucan-1,4-alpha-glucosidase
MTALRIEDYAMISDCQTAALVGSDGSIDWLCFPRFDSPACFANLLGTPDHGRWVIAPQGEIKRTTRRYRDGTLVLETDFETAAGLVTLVDSMPPRTKEPDVVRVVVGRRGKVPMRMQFILRTDYGATVPWVRRTDRGVWAVAGPDSFLLDTPVEMRGEGLTTVAEFEVSEGQEVPFVLLWHPSHLESPPPIDAWATLDATEAWWRNWSDRCTYRGRFRDAVLRSLITLKGLTYAPTGGIVAAATTSLPERIGGVRNWDYRYCWVRDATLTLYSLLRNGYTDEACAWREWLLRAVAGSPGQLNIMYGVAGERRLPEWELDWLPGYESSEPVRVGNAAHEQFQLDVFGELMDTLYQARVDGLPPEEYSWHVQQKLMEFLETAWNEPDEGIWEVRGPRRHFTHSKVMAWVAADRMVKTVSHFKLDGPVDRWRALRDKIHEETCRQGFNPELNSFTQYFDGTELDASTLMIPLVGFLPADDPRVVGTVAAVERELVKNGFVYRYNCTSAVDGLPGGEGTFLPCTFWLVDNMVLQGRHADAERLMDRLLEVRNDVGLLSEQYDPVAKRQLGNFPQAFSHLGLINSALNLSPGQKPIEERGRT